MSVGFVEPSSYREGTRVIGASFVVWRINASSSAVAAISMI